MPGRRGEEGLQSGVGSAGEEEADRQGSVANFGGLCLVNLWWGRKLESVCDPTVRGGWDAGSDGRSTATTKFGPCNLSTEMLKC